MSSVEAEQEVIQGIAESLCRERPGTTITQNWAEAIALYRNVYETEVLPPPEPEERG